MGYSSCISKNEKRINELEERVSTLEETVELIRSVVNTNAYELSKVKEAK